MWSVTLVWCCTARPKCFIQWCFNTMSVVTCENLWSMNQLFENRAENANEVLTVVYLELSVWWRHVVLITEESRVLVRVWNERHRKMLCHLMTENQRERDWRKSPTSKKSPSASPKRESEDPLWTPDEIRVIDWMYRGFEALSRYHQKYKKWVPMAPQKNDKSLPQFFFGKKITLSYV